MVKMHVIYEGDFHTTVTHEPTAQVLHTDAPAAIGGKAQTFSPTDLLSASLATCIATMIGIYGNKKGWDLRGMRLTTEKEISQEGPRRIVALPVEIWMPCPIAEEEKEKLMRVANNCPVHQSLHPEIKAPIHFHWKE